jgi:hypothetical protein
MTCRGCGCTDDRPCEGGCSWAAPNVCSRCIEDCAAEIAVAEVAALGLALRSRDFPEEWRRGAELSLAYREEMGRLEGWLDPDLAAELRRGPNLIVSPYD